jgi:hypothetical protein
MPPPGTIMCTRGWWVSADPQVWSTAVRADALGNLCCLRCFDDDAMQMPGGDRLRRLLTRKEPALCVHHALLPPSLPPLA